MCTWCSKRYRGMSWTSWTQQPGTRYCYIASQLNSDTIKLSCLYLRQQRTKAEKQDCNSVTTATSPVNGCAYVSVDSCISQLASTWLEFLLLLSCFRRPSTGKHPQQEEITCKPAPGGGKLSFISATPGGKSFLYHTWFWISGTVILLAGSGTSILWRRSLHSFETLTWGGNSYSTWSIRCSNTIPVSI